MGRELFLVIFMIINRVLASNHTTTAPETINNNSNKMQKIREMFTITNKEITKSTQNFSRCLTNNSIIETEKKNLKILSPIYLNNLNTKMTSRLVEDDFSIDDVGEVGVRLQDVVPGNCGGSRVCQRWRTEDSTITIGFLGAYRLNPTALGAMTLAVAAVNREPSLLPGKQLRFLAADIGLQMPGLAVNRDSLSLRVMTQMRDVGVVALFGLDGSCRAEAALAAAWDLPLISHKCAVAYGPRRQEGLGSTFARTLPPAYKVGKFVVALLKTFGWNKFSIIAGDPPAAVQRLEAIKELAKIHEMEVTHELRYTDYLPRKLAEIDALVEQSYRNTRIYVFLGESLALAGLTRVLRRRGLTDGSYAVVAVDDEIYRPGAPTNSYADLFGQNSSEDMLAYRAVLKLTPSFPINKHYSLLCEMIRSLSARPPFCVPNQHKLFPKVPVQIEAAHLYDAVTLWARAATAAMRAGLLPTEGAAVMSLLRPTTYSSVQGFDVLMDEAGDAEGNFTVTCLVKDPSTSTGWTVQPVASFRYTNASESLPELVDERISWIGESPPVCEPPCGFDGAKCASLHDPGLWAAVAAVGAIAIFAGALLARHYRYEQKLASVLWKIEVKDLTFISSGKAIGQPDGGKPRCAHAPIALYRGNIVAYKALRKKNIDITRAVKKELKQIRDLRHENLNQFIGVCIESGSACIITSYCSRGSLAKVLSDQDLQLDEMFIASLAADLLRGLTYLHESPLLSHGNLTSSNCLVDSRWVLQIADYGLHNLKSCMDTDDALLSERRMLWRAPELLRDSNPPARGSQKGDVYSFGIILYEMIGRNGPWGPTNLTNAEIIGRVRQPIDGAIFRPSLAGVAARPSVLAVLRACWGELPETRPDLRLVRLRLKDMHAGMKTNMFDNMLAMMERYAGNLEAVVAERTEQLMLERDRAADLLNRMVPRPIAEALQRGERVQAESFASVTVCQINVVNFGTTTGNCTPTQIVDILNDLNACLDCLIALYNVDKVDTSGDAYVVVSGLQERCPRHASEVASMALHILDNVPKDLKMPAECPTLQVRIGIDSGPCSAGVVGSLPKYRVFGPTMETAAMLEANTEPQSINVSQRTYSLLRDNGYQFRQKNNGEEKTWLLIGAVHKRRTITKSRLTAGSTSANNSYVWASSGAVSTLDIRDRARLSCSALGPIARPLSPAVSSPGRPACACFVPPRDRHSAPAVNFFQE